MDSRLVIQCTAIGAAGALVAQTLATSAFPIVESPPLAVAGAAGIAAVLANKSRWLEAAGVAGLVILVLVQFTAADPRWTTVGAGLVLGCAAGLAKTQLHQTALGGGVLVGIVLNGMVFEQMPRRYAAYLAEPTPNFWRLALIALTVITLLWASWPSSAAPSAQIMVVSIGLPLAVAAAMQIPDNLLMSLAIAGSVIVGAALLPGRSGLALLAGGAIAASWSGLAFLTPTTGAVIVGLVIAGFAVGLRRPYVFVGIAIVAVCFIPFPAHVDFLFGLSAFVAAAGAAYGLASSMATPAPVLALAVAAPFYLAAAVSSGVQWTAYTPLTDGPPTEFLRGWLPVLILAAYAAAAYALSRRTARA